MSDDAGTLVPFDPQPVASISVEWFTTDDGEKLGFSMTVEGEATDRQWVAGALLQLAAEVARHDWEWTEGEPGEDDPTPADALQFPVTPPAAAGGATVDPDGEE